jgi:hypothetical protein
MRPCGTLECAEFDPYCPHMPHSQPDFDADTRMHYAKDYADEDSDYMTKEAPDD